MEFRILGPVEVHGATARARLGGAKQLALLATLTVHANHLTTTEQLIDSIWADAPPAGAVAAVHTYVSRLRRSFDAVEEDGGKRIVTRPTGYTLNLAPGELDLEKFREHVNRGRQAADSGRFADASAELGVALALWRGPALVDVSSEVLQRVEVPRLTEEWHSALERRVAADLELGRHADLIGELRALTSEHPLRDQYWRQLMLALYRSNRQAEALAVYEEVRKLHAEEIGIDPGHELQQLHVAILADAPSLNESAAPAPAPAPTPRNLPTPAQLPADIAGLVGRESLAESVSALLRAGPERHATPIAVLAGLPGVGKTALATHVAHRLRPRFPDGQLYVNLRGYALAEPVLSADVLARFLRALGLPSDLVPLDADERVAMYRSLLADKRVLIVLDNANAAEQVRPLLPAEPGCAVLITSRDLLSGLTARDGADRFTLDVLTPADAMSLLGTVLGEAQVRAEPEAAGELAELCGYLPLALRIAAANLSTRRHSTVREYVERLRAGNRLAALAVENDEQTGVRAAFNLSYASLTTDAARLFRSLALVPGPDFDTYAAAALLNTDLPRAGQLLGALADASLVQDAGPGRHQLHDLVRQYALYRGRFEDDATIRDHTLSRLYSYYFQTTKAASGLIEPTRRPPEPPEHLPRVRLPEFADRAAAASWFEQEDPNLRAAVNHAAEHGPRPYAWYLADAMTSPLALAPRFADWVTVAQIGHRAAAAAGDRAGEAIMLLSLGHAYNTTGKLVLAIDALRRALELYQQLDRSIYQIPCHHTLGVSLLWTGQLAEAVEHLTTTLELCEQNPFPNHEGYAGGARHGLGVAYRYLGKLPESLELLTRCCEALPEGVSRYVLASWRFSLALTYRDLGRFEQAITELTETLEVYEQLGNAFGISRCLVALASTYAQTGQHDAATSSCTRGLSLARQVKHRRTEVDALNVLGKLAEEEGELAGAGTHHARAQSIAEGMGPYLFGRIEARIGLASVAERGGDPHTARLHAEAALDSIRDAGFLLHEAPARLVLARIDQASGDEPAAARHGNLALAAARRAGQRAWEELATRQLHRFEHRILAGDQPSND